MPGVGLPGLIWRAEFGRVDKAHRHRLVRLIECPVGVRQADRAWFQCAAPDGGEHAVEFRVWHLLGGERAQVVVLVRHDLRTRTQGRHFAVADVGQPGDLGDLADFGNCGQIQWVISCIPGHDRRRQRQAERIEHRHGDLDLG